MINKNNIENIREKLTELHNAFGVPNDGIGVEGSCGIKPEMKLLFFIAFAFGIDVGMDCIWFSCNIT